MELLLYTEGFFDAAHFIVGHEGKCSSLHGHSWKIAVWVKGNESSIDSKGIMWDFGNVKKITEELDHKNLNEVMPGNPTAERIMIYIFNKMKFDRPDLLFKVRVYENIVSKVSYCEGGDLQIDV